MGIRVCARNWIALCALAVLCLLAAGRARTRSALPLVPSVTNTATVAYVIGRDAYTQSASVDVHGRRARRRRRHLAGRDAGVGRARGRRPPCSRSWSRTPATATSRSRSRSTRCWRGDQFDPTNARIYIDANGSGIYEPGVDPLYQTGVNDPLLAADAARLVFVLADIPPATSERRARRRGARRDVAHRRRHRHDRRRRRRRRYRRRDRRRHERGDRQLPRLGSVRLDREVGGRERTSAAATRPRPARRSPTRSSSRRTAPARSRTW